MRRALIVFAIVVVAVVVLLVIAASLLNVNRFRPSIEAELQKKLNRPVTLGQMHLRLLPFSIKVDGLTIQESPAYSSTRPFATAKEVYVSAGLLSLIRGRPTIKALTLEDPQIELIRNASGTWNFSDLGGDSKQPQTNTGGNSTTQFTLDTLKIDNGQLAVTDEHSKTPRTVYNQIDLRLADFSPGKQFNVHGAAHFPGPGKETLAFSGKAGPLQSGNTPVNGHLSIQQVSLTSLNAITNGMLSPNTNAVASGEADIAEQNGNISCKGNLNLADAAIGGKKVGYPIDAQYDLTINQASDHIQVNTGTVKLSSTAVSLTGGVDQSAKPANLNMRLTTNNASVPDLLYVASLFGGNSNTSNQIKGNLSADLAVRGAVTAPNVQGNLSAGSLQAQGLVLNNVHSTLNMDNGVARLSPLTAGVFGGQANGTLSLDTKPAQPACSVQMKLSGADANALLSAVSSVKDTLYGSLAADANLSFTVDSGPNLARTLNGTLGFNVTNGQLKNVNILNELSRVGKFVGSSQAQATPNTALQRLSGTLNIQNGVATTNNLIATLAEGSLSGTGSLNLVNQGINMHVTAVLANTVSKQVGGTGIGGFLNVALANNKGELVLPVLVTGSMAHPVFAPDVQAIAKMKMNHLLPTTGDPSKLTSGALGSVLGGALGQQPANQGKSQQQQQNPINSILNQLGKKKK
jgi:AsmA protein